MLSAPGRDGRDAGLGERLAPLCALARSGCGALAAAILLEDGTVVRAGDAAAPGAAGGPDPSEWWRAPWSPREADASAVRPDVPAGRSVAGAPVTTAAGRRIGRVVALEPSRGRDPLPFLAQVAAAVAETADLWSDNVRLRARGGAAAGAEGDPDAAERELAAVLDSIPALVLHLEADGRCRRANRLLETWFGTEPRSFVGRGLDTLLDAETYAQCGPHLAAALAGERRDVERRLPTPEGGWRDVMVSYVPDRRGGEVRGVLILAVDVGGLKEVEARLRASEAFLDRAGRVAGVGAWSVELGTGEITWSERTRLIHEAEEGYRPTLAGALEFYPPEGRARIEAALAAAMEHGRGWDLELPFVTAKGRPIWVRAVGEVERLEDGRTRLFGVFQEVTARRAAEAELRAKEAQYRLLADNVTDVIVLLDREFRRLYVSPASKEVFGREPQSLLGLDPRAALHEEDLARVEAAYAALAAGAERADSMHRIRHADGSMRWVEAVYRRVEDPGTREHTGYLMSLRDVDRRQAAERMLARSEARFRLLAENTSELIMLGWDDGRVSYVSPASRRLLGHEPEALASMAPDEYVDAADLAVLRASVPLLGDERGEATALVRMRHQARGWIWCEAAFRRIPGDRAADPTILATFRDVSERQAQGEALRLAKEAAEQASQAKSDFLAAMSHEIRTPLNGILGYTELLLDDPGLDDLRTGHVERIQTAGASLLAVVDDILDFSKIEAGRIELEAEPFDLRACAENAAAIVRGQARRKGIALDVEIDAALPDVVVGDVDRLRQVLLNLLVNAVKFTRRGGVRLVAGVRGEDAGRVELELRVEDTGIGIPADKIGRLFQRFSQVDGSVRREYGGTGLGLAISKNLVEMMGGGIAVASRPGEGSSFTVSLAMRRGAAAPPARPPEGPADGRGRPATILLAEDLELNRDLARRVLEHAGHRVDVAVDGREAVEAVQRRAYDLVLMDVQMPVMDGMTATEAIRRLEHPCRSVPIVAMTANVLPTQIAQFRASGMDAHVGKPFKRGDLLAAVARWTGGAPGPDTAPEGGPIQETVFDESVFRQIGDIADADLVHYLLAKLRKELATRFGAGQEATPETLRGHAHAMVSPAGMLGFAAFAGLCRDLEAAACGVGDRAGAARRIPAVLAATLGAIDSLLARTPTPAGRDGQARAARPGPSPR